MTTREVAAYLHVRERKVYDLIRAGEIPCTRVSGKWLFPRTLIDRWLAFLPAHNMDGIVFDTFNPYAYEGTFRDTYNCPNGAIEGAVHTSFYWATTLRDWTVQLMAAFDA